MLRTLFAVLLSAGLLAGPALADAQESDFAQFGQFAKTSKYDLDYGVYQSFLGSAVFQVGYSTRKRASNRDGGVGSRVTRGHRGKFRLEANRVTFSRLPRDAVKALSTYRQDLQAIPGQIDFHKLSKNEALAYWLNLHNVLVIEQLAIRYPLNNIEDRYDEIFESKIATVAGVPLSINDIRLRIVYEHWDDPLVIYGFYHGVIGGPSIQIRAFTGKTVERTLRQAAFEFVNSLRGVSERRGVLEVSQIYDEARGFFEAWPEDLISHLNDHARDDVKSLLEGAGRVEAETFDWQIADLTAASPSGNYSQVLQSSGGPASLRGFGDLPPHAQDFVKDVYQRQREYMRDNPSAGQVIIIDEPLEDKADSKTTDENEPDQ